MTGSFLLKIYPALRRAGINFSALKKIAWGYYTGTTAMIWAAGQRQFPFNRCYRFIIVQFFSTTYTR